MPRQARHDIVASVYLCAACQANAHFLSPPRPTFIFACRQRVYDMGPQFYICNVLSPRIFLLFSIPIIPEDLESSRRDLALGSVKTRFKAILKNSIFGFGFVCGHLSWSIIDQLATISCRAWRGTISWLNVVYE